MRTQTRNFVSTIGLGVLGVSYFVGAQAAENSLTPFDQAAAQVPIATPTAPPTATASQAAPQPTATKKTTKPKTTTTKKKTTTSSGSTSSGSTSSGASGTQSASKNYTVQGDNNVVQLSVTMKSGKITDVDYSGSTATEGRYAVFPNLVQAALDANGTGFSNISGATYTVKAFKSALSAALAKF